MAKIFWLGRFCISLGLAKSGSWGITTNTEDRTYWVGIHTLKNGSLSATSVIVGPVSITIGRIPSCRQSKGV